ncbi:MAG: EAL domain-containing protein [Alphaproteobacteria bacterium]|nr:EAL domain-containing protein [Alphaproteobacteria bacterium]MBM3952348.1 EAL domain-containing protein [Rhodospirillales bacterium]
MTSQGSASLAQRFVALAFCRADALFELDDRQNVVFAAGATDRLLGKAPDALKGIPFKGLFTDKGGALIADLLAGAGAQGRIDDVMLEMPLASGAIAQVALAGYRAADFDGHFFVALKVAPRRIIDTSRAPIARDSETGLMAKNEFAAVAAERIKSMQDAGQKTKVTMVNVANLENLRGEIPKGAHENVLKAIGGVLNRYSVGGDTATRIDGENFGFVHGDNVDIPAVNQEMLAATCQVHSAAAQLKSKTSTIEIDPAALTEDQIVKALIYSMRTFSKNPSAVENKSMSSLLESRVTETMKMVETFQAICRTRNFDLVYMPICHLKTHQVHHFEALTRFREGGKKGTSSPYEMITLAEEMGIVAEFDLAVTRKAIDFAVKSALAGLPPIAVNISGHSIGNADFNATILSLLGSATNIAGKIMFEITESSEIKDLEGVNRAIQGFRKKGFKMALDDFGAGAASFDYLNTLDVDTVKFDGPVVKRAYATDKGRAFLASMATLCNSMGIETIAEMVEDEPLAKFLAGCDVHLGQGYYFGKADADPAFFLSQNRARVVNA